MKKYIEFEMPQDEHEFNMANEGPAYHSVLWELSQKLRTCLKHGHSYKTADAALEAMQKLLYDCMDENQCHFQD